jgi:hypothetical protein
MDDHEKTVQENLQRDIYEDDASGRKVENVTCREQDESICIARVGARGKERFVAVKIDESGGVLARVDQGEVKPGPVEDGVKRDLQAMLDQEGLGAKVLDVSCDRETFECRARIDDDGQERVEVVLVALDDSDDYSLVTMYHE